MKNNNLTTNLHVQISHLDTERIIKGDKDFYKHDLATGIKTPIFTNKKTQIESVKVASSKQLFNKNAPDDLVHVVDLSNKSTEKNFKFFQLYTQAEDFIMNLLYINPRACSLFLIFLHEVVNFSRNEYNINIANSKNEYAERLGVKKKQFMETLHFLNKINAIKIEKASNGVIDSISLNANLAYNGKDRTNALYIDSFSTDMILKNKTNQREKLPLKPIHGNKPLHFRAINIKYISIMADLAQHNPKTLLLFLYMIREMDKTNAVDMSFSRVSAELTPFKSHKTNFNKSVKQLVDLGLIEVLEFNKTTGERCFAVNHNIVWNSDRKVIKSSSFKHNGLYRVEHADITNHIEHIEYVERVLKESYGITTDKVKRAKLFKRFYSALFVKKIHNYGDKSID